MNERKKAKKEKKETITKLQIEYPISYKLIKRFKYWLKINKLRLERILKFDEIKPKSE